MKWLGQTRRLVQILPYEAHRLTPPASDDLGETNRRGRWSRRLIRPDGLNNRPEGVFQDQTEKEQFNVRTGALSGKGRLGSKSNHYGPEDRVDLILTALGYILRLLTSTEARKSEEENNQRWCSGTRQRSVPYIYNNSWVQTYHLIMCKLWRSSRPDRSKWRNESRES